MGQPSAEGAFESEHNQHEPSPGFLRANTLNTKPPTWVFEREPMQQKPSPGFLRVHTISIKPRPGFLRATTGNTIRVFEREHVFEREPMQQKPSPGFLRATKSAKTLTRVFESAHDQHQFPIKGFESDHRDHDHSF